MTTRLKIGPRDHGMPLSLEEFLAAEAEEGYHYELINGRLYVSPAADAPEGFVERWVRRKLEAYAATHPGVINYVHNKARVFVPDRPGVTAPEPDLAAYHDFPLHLPSREFRWEDVSPVVVVEVLSGDHPEKDLVRNVGLYLQVPSTQEYWILDAREDSDKPTLIVYRRYRRRWRKALTFEPGSAYTTDLLPGFRLVIAPRA